MKLIKHCKYSGFKFIKLILLIFTIGHFGFLYAQDGLLDATFNPGTGVNASVYSIGIQSDGKIIIGGAFTSFNGIARNHIARINADGSLDATFNPGTGTNGEVFSISIQSDGKIIIGGNFAFYNGIARNGIVRINANGSVDATFNPGSAVNGYVRSTAIQSDGKILVGGNFTLYNGTARNNIVRVNSDGTLDATFDPGTGANNSVGQVSIQSNGKIVIVGDFTSYNGKGRNHVARLNADGTIDTVFNPGNAANTSIYAVSILSSFKIIIGGGFTKYNGFDINCIARLNTNGLRDATFDPGSGANSGVRTTSIQCDDKIIIGGSFTLFNGTSMNFIARLNADGSRDATFYPGTGANNIIVCSAIQGDGKIIIGGDFTSYNGTSINRIARIIGTSSGIMETSFFKDLMIYPNPSSGIFILQEASGVNLINDMSLAIYNVLGEKIMFSKITTGKTRIDLRNQPNGIYYIMLIKDGVAVKTEKIVKG